MLTNQVDSMKEVVTFEKNYNDSSGEIKFPMDCYKNGIPLGGFIVNLPRGIPFFRSPRIYALDLGDRCCYIVLIG